MNVGFFYGKLIKRALCTIAVNLHALAVKNHGIPPECIDKVLNVNRVYYRLPVEEKMKVRSCTLSIVVAIANELRIGPRIAPSQDCRQL
jgi:isopenicillin N synthase-like dioxygenase